MKTIMIKDDVYMKLSKIKGSKSFSDLLEELSDKSNDSNKAVFRKIFGLMTDKEAGAAMERIGKMRKNAKVRSYEITA
ncbi:MAG: antitoxin VapB family protein [Candidatus Micrarchaeota archaeon]|nr:antitoxin VapB family protein [Candidatus Micrarchaeota archaeon]